MEKKEASELQDRQKQLERLGCYCCCFEHTVAGKRLLIQDEWSQLTCRNCKSSSRGAGSVANIPRQGGACQPPYDGGAHYGHWECCAMVAGHQGLSQVLGEAIGVGETPLLHVFGCLHIHKSR